MDHKIILFYRYVFIDNIEEMISYLHNLCSELKILGRILVANEGINGTLASGCNNIDQFMETLVNDPKFKNIDWKISLGRGNLPFNDLHVKQVKELIGCGEAKSVIDGSISFDEDTYGGLAGTGVHLSPAAFHDAILNNDGILLDIRNDYEYSIGHFNNAINLSTNTFAETWRALDKVVEQQANSLSEKKSKNIYMYCTGGIRCEKASAYMKLKGFENVYHLQGGIHRYMEQFSEDPSNQFVGKEFVFDGRIATSSSIPNTKDSDCEKGDSAYPKVFIPTDKHPSFTYDSNKSCVKNSDSPLEKLENHKHNHLTSKASEDKNIIGKCVDCDRPHDIYSGLIVCTVCRMPLLCCPQCVSENPYPGEYYCVKHRSLKFIYFTMIDRFSIAELKNQASQLLSIENSLLGKAEKNRRRTMRRQRERILAHLSKSEDKDELVVDNTEAGSKQNDKNVNMNFDTDNLDLLSLHKLNPKIHSGKGFFWQSFITS